MFDGRLGREGAWRNTTTGQIASRGEARALDAAAKGMAREKDVARLIGGQVSRQKVVVKGLGSTDIDVVGPCGELVGVGGPAKADLSRLGRQLQILKKAAENKRVTAMYYFEEGTSEAALKLARKWLGAENVKTFPK